MVRHNFTPNRVPGAGVGGPPHRADALGPRAAPGHLRMPRPLPRGPAPRGGHAEGRLPPKPGRRRWLLFGDGVALLDWNISVSNLDRNIKHDPGGNSRTIGLSPTTTADQRKGGGAPWPRPVLRYVTERLLTRPRGDLVATGLGLICGSDCLSLSTARRWPGLWNGVRRRKGTVRRECAT